MAIAFDSKTNFLYNASTATHTYSHTCSGVDRILFVGVSVRDTRTVTGVTYNGVSMTQSGSLSTTTGIKNYLFYLVNPSTGSNTVSITQSASDTITSCSISYTGAAQSGQPDATSVGGPSSGVSYSQSVTSVADNCFAILYGDNNSGATLTAGSNTTIRNNCEVAFTGAFLLDSTTAKTPAGTFTLAFTSASGSAAACMASFKPSVPISTGAAFLFTMI